MLPPLVKRGTAVQMPRALECTSAVPRANSIPRPTLAPVARVLAAKPLEHLELVQLALRNSRERMSREAQWQRDVYLGRGVR